MSGIEVSKLRKQKKNKGASTSISDILNYDISLTGKTISDKQKEQFYSDLGTLIEAGIDIRTALDLLLQGFKKKDRFRPVVEQMLSVIVKGDALSGTLRKSKHFTEYEASSVQIGEETGKLGYVLNELGKFYEGKIRLRRQLIGALFYPGMITVVACGTIAFIFYFIVPMFKDVFERFGGELPAITQFIVDVSELLTNNGWVIVSVFAALAATYFVVRTQAWYSKYAALFLLKIPFFGEMVRKNYIVRMCNSFSLMLSSRIPLLQAIKLTNRMLSFYPLNHALSRIEKEIEKGRSLSAVMEEFPLFDLKMTTLVRVGEEINRTEDFFRKIAEQYSAELEYKTRILGTLIEPILIIFLGVVVGIILIAMYLPLFQMSNTFG